MNNLPDDYKEEPVLDDGVWELACHLFSTDKPNGKQLHMAVDYMEEKAEANQYEE